LTLWFLAMLGTTVGSPQSSFALDPLPRSPRVGSLRIPLLSYNRVPISALLSDSASYHLREIRIAGIVRAPMLAAGDRVELLVHVIGKIDRPGSSPEVFTLWIERDQE
jgi:hypothetical protein